jgi:choline-sulfatase
MYDHIVLVSIDTLRSDCIQANPLKLWPHKYPGLRAPATTVLDDLVARGAFFANCVSAAPYTSASHATLFSGKWPLKHGVFEFFNRKLTGGTIFTRGRNDGYATIMKSDFPLILGPTLGFDRGIDRFIVEDDEAYLEAIAASPRSISLAHFGGVHVPYGFHNLHYGGDAYRRKLKELEAEVGEPEGLPSDQLLETHRDAEDTRYLLRYKRVVQELWQAGRAPDIFGLYLDGIEHFLKTRFEPFLDKLTKRLEGTRWLMVVFGDHGEEYDADSFGHFNSVAEGVLRVPLLFLGSDVRPGIHRQRMRTVDVLPTILELQNGRPIKQRGLDGQSCAKTVREGTPFIPAPAFAQAYVADTARFIRFQKKSLDGGPKRGSLPHLLFKETVWDGEYKLSRTLASFERYLGGLAPIETPLLRLERFDEGQVPHVVEDAAVERHMAQLLSGYAALRR